MKPQKFPVDDRETGKEKAKKQRPLYNRAQCLPGATALFGPLPYGPCLFTVCFSASPGLWGAAYLQDSYNISRETAGEPLNVYFPGYDYRRAVLGMMSNRFFRARRPVLMLGTLGMPYISGQLCFPFLLIRVLFILAALLCHRDLQHRLPD